MFGPVLLGSALCALCARAQDSDSPSASIPTASASSASSGSVSGSAISATSTKAATTTATYPAYDLYTATTLSQNPLPSIFAAATLTESPDYSRFPYSSFWSGFEPGVSTVEIQPIVVNPLEPNVTFALNNSSPFSVPLTDTLDDSYLPPSINATLNVTAAEILSPGVNASSFSTPQSQAIAANATQQIVALINGSATDAASECQTCYQALAIAQQVAQQVPYEVPNMLINLCNMYQFSTTAPCSILYSAVVEGGPATQVLYYANLTTDAQTICNTQFKKCSKPGVTDYYPKASDLITVPKPANATAPVPSANGTRLIVPHLSDIHLDTRYYIGAEGNCSQGLCCRERSTNKGLLTTVANASVPAARLGSFLCDSPYDLVISAFQAVPDMLGANNANFTLYTGDLVTHESVPFTQVNTPYAKYEESMIYQLFKSYLGGANGSAPVYASISNHDNRYGSGWNAPEYLQPSYLQDLYQEDYDQLAGLWQYEGWLTSDEAQQSRTHFTAYSAKTPFGLRIISLNANAWYPSNLYTMLNVDNADGWGMFNFTASELQKAEDAGERVWLIMHQPLGWSGTDNLPNPTDLMYQIIDRYSPHVIAGIFNGHTHEDQAFLFFSNNGTSMTEANAQTVSWAGPSITPLTGLNSGWKVYSVAADTFDVMDISTFYTNVTANQNTSAPVWQFEYSHRATYGQNISWPDDAPLNATYLFRVQQQMQQQPDLVETFRLLQGKSSTRTTNCTSAACQKAIPCYIRSGSWALAQQCPAGYGSVQG